MSELLAVGSAILGSERLSQPPPVLRGRASNKRQGSRQVLQPRCGVDGHQRRRLNSSVECCSTPAPSARRGAIDAEIAGSRSHACGVKRWTELRLQRHPENEILSYCPLPLAMSMLALALLPSCALTSLPPGSLPPWNRAQLCRIEVDARLPRPVFVANPLSTESGAASGFASGVLQGLATGPAAIVGVPFYAIFGAAAGAACAEGASRYPSANADYERILGTANIGVLKEAVELELADARAECRPATADTSASARPDAIVEIEKIESGMACLRGKQEYAVAVHWRVVSTRGSRVLAASETVCSVTSFRGVGDWFADPAYARAEIERLLEKAGRRVAVSLLGPVTPGRCVYRSREDGQLE